jgi:hypothetical protein
MSNSVQVTTVDGTVAVVPDVTIWYSPPPSGVKLDDPVISAMCQTAARIDEKLDKVVDTVDSELETVFSRLAVLDKEVAKLKKQSRGK